MPMTWHHKVAVSIKVSELSVCLRSVLVPGVCSLQLEECKRSAPGQHRPCLRVSMHFLPVMSGSLLAATSFAARLCSSALRVLACSICNLLVSLHSCAPCGYVRPELQKSRFACVMLACMCYICSSRSSSTAQNCAKTFVDAAVHTHGGGKLTLLLFKTVASQKQASSHKQARC